MKQFIIRFSFEGQEYAASVTEIGGLDDTQYAISPQDGKLAERFKTTIIRKPKDEEGYQYALPEGLGATAFMESLVKGLEKSLQ